MWDVAGGGDKMRPLWLHYYKNTDGVIFVVDSNDQGRVAQAREELQKLLLDDELRDACLLVFANKQGDAAAGARRAATAVQGLGWSGRRDMPNALSTAELTERLDL
eukprot:gene2458-4209_t